MSGNNEPLPYEIFGQAFQILKKSSGTGNESSIAKGIVQLLEQIKNQIEPSSRQNNLKRDFYRWLALQCLRVSLNPLLVDTAAQIIRHFVEVLHHFAKTDPLVILDILNMLTDSLNGTSNVNSYYLRKGDAIFAVKSQDSRDGFETTSVSHLRDIRPTCVFFLLLLDGKMETFTHLDQTYTFRILTAIIQIYKISDVDLRDQVIMLFPQIINTLYPSNRLQWEVIHSVFLVYHSAIEQSQSINLKMFESLQLSINHVVSNFSSFDASLAELIFMLAAEAAYSIALLDCSADLSSWVQTAVTISDRIDFTSVYMDMLTPKLLATRRCEFVPLIGAYLVKALEVDIQKCHEPDASMEVDQVVIVEQKSPTWKLCREVLESAPMIGYSTDSYERTLNLASDLIVAGRRISFLLRFKYKNTHFEMFNSRSLRPLTAIPFMCEECLSQPLPSKFESFVRYVKTMLALFAECKGISSVEDKYLIEHVFTLFTLPWQPVYAHNFSEEAKLDCLDGIVNLVSIIPGEKSLKYVAIFINVFFKHIISEDNNTVLRKLLSSLILLIFQIPQDAIFEIFRILKGYLMPDKLEILLNNEYLGNRLLCFLSNRCIVKMGTENWELLCVDCDHIENGAGPIAFAFNCFSEYVAHQFLDFLRDTNFPLKNVNKMYLRFSSHSDYLKTGPSVQSFLTRSVAEPQGEPILVDQIIFRLCYNSSGEVNKEIVINIYQTLCVIMKELQDVDNDLKKPKLDSIVGILKKLVKVPYPNSVSVFKLLISHCLSPNFDIYCVRALFKIALSTREKSDHQFWNSHEPNLAKFIVGYLIHEGKVLNTSIASMFQNILYVLGLKTDEAVSQNSLMSTILFEIICKCKPNHSGPIISEIASLFLNDTNTFLDKHYDSIFAKIYSLEDETIFKQNLLPLFELHGLSFDNRLDWEYSHLVSKLILHSYHPLKVFRFLFHHKQNENAKNQLADLKQHFIGCLTIIESTLPKNESLQTAKDYIACIYNCIKLFGPEIVATIQVTVLTTLRICLPLYYNTLPKHCIKAWTYFCFSVDVKIIGPYVPTILVHVLPLLEKFPDAVSNIFHYFVVENGEHYREQLPLLYFVPCHPNLKMQQVWCVIQSSLLVKGSCCRNILTTLESVYSDSTETKKIALDRLRMCLSDHASKLCESLNAGDNDDTAEIILTCLLDNITHKSNEVKILSATCLGHLGAIDPKKFGFNEARKSYTPQKYNLAADDFSVLCITKILHCLGRYDDCNITRILYSTLQELLRLHLEGKPENEKLPYLEKFNIQDRYVLIPLLQSKYIIKGVTIDRKTLAPISYKSHASKTPCEWAAMWATHLLSRMPPSTQRTLFSTCLPMMKIDIEVAETVLPYILLYALLSCDPSDVDLIEREMKFILRWDLTKHRTKPDNLMMIEGELKKNIIHSDVSQTKYVSMILDLLDFLNQVASDCYFFKANLGLLSQDQLELKIKGFISRFPGRAMSLKSFIQEDHARALYYMEKDSAELKVLDCIKPLRNIYSKLNDIDGLIGVVKSSNCSPSTEESIVNDMVYGTVQDALSSYERMCSKYQSTNTYRGLIQCYIEVNQPSTALAIAQKIMNDEKYLKPNIFSEYVEALWSSSCYKETDLLLEELKSSFSTGSTWSIDSADLYRRLTSLNHASVLEKLKDIRLGIVHNLTNLNRSRMNLYRQGYWYIVKLHILNDIETFTQTMFTVLPKENDEQMLKQVWDCFDQRIAVLPAHGPYVRDVRKSHLQTLDTFFNATGNKLANNVSSNISSYLGKMWLDLAKKARNKRCLQEAYTCIGIAEKYNPPKLFIELAKYHQAKFDTDRAVLVLKQGLQQKIDLDSGENKKICALAHLLIARFEVGNMNLDFTDGYSAFTKAVNICDLEKSYVCLATYLYRQHLTEMEPDNSGLKRHIQLDAARYFSKSLHYGMKHIYQSMPCILTLWLDYGARVVTKLSTVKKTDENTTDMFKVLKDFISLMENNLVHLPTYMFMTAFSQILSRINHRLSSYWDVLAKIILKIVAEYPQQAMWSFFSVCRSKIPLQAKRTEEICKRIKAIDYDHARFFKVFNQFADRLIDVAMKKLKCGKEVNLNQLSPKLLMMMDEIRNVPIMLPLQRFLTVNVGTRRSGHDSNDEQHTPFPLKPIFITDVKSNILVLISIQAPKRLEFVGSDGEVYPLMCKQDDLRLDSRFMEFNSIINSLLRTDSVSSEKELSIRTYSVVPLNSECGIIEWLNGLSSLKSIIMDMYSKLNIQMMPMSQIKKLMLVRKDQVTLVERQRRFVEDILPKHPPVLHKWFFARHPCPEAWFHCRNAFVKTSAVMSIVGYIVGLGDRHCENILIDSVSGEAVHVDFNCLFNRSDRLTYPETVPFRLTHNLVRAMGATGVEGLFINSAEATARVVRHNSEQLLSVLKPFLYDTDVKPYNPRRYVPKNAGALVADDISNDEAKINIQDVEMRLNGVVRCKNNQWAQHRNSKPLSVEGQTRMLIKEATSHVNLCQMFAGWSPYL